MGRQPLTERPSCLLFHLGHCRDSLVILVSDRILHTDQIFNISQGVAETSADFTRLYGRHSETSTTSEFTELNVSHLDETKFRFNN